MRSESLLDLTFRERLLQFFDSRRSHVIEGAQIQQSQRREPLEMLEPRVADPRVGENQLFQPVQSFEILERVVVYVAGVEIQFDKARHAFQRIQPLGSDL